MKGKTIEELGAGDAAEFSKTVTESDIAGFAEITGDFNPVHLDETYARKTPFRGRIAHGILAAGFISAVIGMQLPGPGTIYIEQAFRFRFPVRMGDTITARVEVLAIEAGKNLVRLKTTCSNQDGRLVLDGEAVVMPPRR